MPSLTGLRGIAAVWVVLYHFGNRYFTAIEPGAAGYLLEKGYLAVDLFFILSGFVLAHVYLDEFSAKRSKALWPFFQARFARLYPLHFVVLALFILDAALPQVRAHILGGEPLNIKVFGAQSVAATFANLFMLQGVKASELSWNFPAWSISVEFAAYVLFGIVAVHSRRARIRPVLLCLGLLGGWLVFFNWLIAGNFNQWDGWAAFARCVPEFFVGALLYALTREMPSYTIWPNALTFGLLLGILFLLQLRAPDLVIVLLFAVAVPLVVRDSGVASWILNAPVIVLLGELSYALYLVHGLVQIGASRLLSSILISDLALSPMHSLAFMIGLLGLAVLIAYCAHRTIEVPARGYIRRQFQSGMPGAGARLGRAGLCASAIPQRLRGTQ